MKSIKRKDFIKKAAVAAAGSSALLAACGQENKSSGAPGIINNKTYEWLMVTAWPPHFPILGEGADRIAKDIESMSGGRLKIKVYGGGELVPAMEAFDAVSQGVAQLSHAASYYWAGKVPAAQLFTSVPFGMNTQQTNTWLNEGGGMNLWRELYSRFNLIPFCAGNTGGQMGGWFNKAIKSVDDLKGLKMRMPGLGGKIITKAGASAVLSPGGEIYTNLERGVIDATDWVGPYHDWLMGFHKIARYYYYPSFAEPTGVVELAVNRDAYNELPDDLKSIVEAAAAKTNGVMLSEFESKNAEYLQKIKNDSKVIITQFPDDVINTFRKYAKETLDELTSSDEFSKKILDSYNKFRSSINDWTEISEKYYI